MLLVKYCHVVGESYMMEHIIHSGYYDILGENYT